MSSVYGPAYMTPNASSNTGKGATTSDDEVNVADGTMSDHRFFLGGDHGVSLLQPAVHTGLGPRLPNSSRDRLVQMQPPEMPQFL
ncbi:unnamed protein product [Mesocestoides corti]|uniref:Uncharacterized protein n=1 Tax=Mesocestoides corti TaxID=53468 RepID=A0A0R3U815_MESCO|nr:unnamed protein product [Mesocestoides corti]